jgi:hypothetical protein
MHQGAFADPPLFPLEIFKFGPQFSQSLFKQRFLRLEQGTSVIFAKGKNYTSVCPA